MGEAKNRKHEIEALKARGKKVGHTQDELMTAIIGSMRNHPSWWEERISVFEIAPKQITIALQDPWGGIAYIEAFDLINLWNEVKAA